ncbi:PLP-dependent aminotransferase family protein [Brevibacillus sp. B_LB10_24]|uniref:aminotransferase-like domain-containing protein n=1 Tax=Brevibacillus sp. B_LB10_24 TaxID=3380645 RepID=UPI0038BDBFDA
MGRKPIYRRVHEQLRYQILSGEWPIGSALPPERKLADQLGVSRNSVVRAYAELEEEGLILCRTGSGRYVQPLQPVSSLTRLDWRESLDHHLYPSPSHMAELLSFSGPQSKINFAHGDGGRHTLASSGFSEYVCKAAGCIDAYSFLPVDGHPLLREWIVSWMGLDQVSSAEQVVVTSGSQEALYLVASLLAKPGDTVAVEMPTYFGALQLFQSLGLSIIPVPIDREGMRTDVLEGILARYRPRFVYTVPTFHNPTGYTLSLSRRRHLVSLSETHGFPIVEDDAYRHLHLSSPPPVPLKALDQTGSVIYMNTFSKLLFPGQRLGWIAASRQLVRMITRMKELSISTNTLGQMALYDFVRDGCLPPHLERVRTMYDKQAALMERHLASLSALELAYEKPAGGFYFWISLPEGLDVREVLQDCLSQGVSFACGDMFLTREAVQPFIRLCFTHETAGQIDAGMAILASVLHKRKESLR